jgi:phosphoglucosamine mutase
MLAVDNKGNPMDGDIIMAICAMDLKRRGVLAKDTLVGTVMSNQGLDIFCNEQGITLERADVGDRYVLEKMLEHDYNLGGEQSGHLIFREYATTGDGILSGLQLIRALAHSDKPLSELRNIMTVYPQILKNAVVNPARKYEYTTHEVINAKLEEIETNLAGRGRILVRTSGTEALVRVMIEGENVEEITKEAKGLASFLENIAKEVEV